MNKNEIEKKDKEFRKKAFIEFFNNKNADLILEIIENLIVKQTNFDNPNFNYYRDGQLSILDFIKKHREDK